VQYIIALCCTVLNFAALHYTVLCCKALHLDDGVREVSTAYCHAFECGSCRTKRYLRKIERRRETEMRSSKEQFTIRRNHVFAAPLVPCQVLTISIKIHDDVGDDNVKGKSV
jgi:hypothetical protein